MKNFRFLNTDFVFVILTLTKVCSYFAEVEADPLPYGRPNYNFAHITKIDAASDDEGRNIGEENVDPDLKSEKTGRSLNSDMRMKGGDNEGLFATGTGLRDNDGKDSVLRLPSETGNTGAGRNSRFARSARRKTVIRRNQGQGRNGESLNRTVEGMSNVPVPEVDENNDETSNSGAKVALAPNKGVAQLSSENEKAVESTHERLNGSLDPLIQNDEADSKKHVMRPEGRNEEIESSDGNNEALHGNVKILGNQNEGAHSVENKQHGDMKPASKTNEAANAEEENSNGYDKSFGTGEGVHDSDDSPNDPVFHAQVETNKGNNEYIVSGDNVVSNGKDLHQSGERSKSNEKDSHHNGDKDAAPSKTVENKQNSLNAVVNANHDVVNDDSPGVQNVGNGEKGSEIEFSNSDNDKKGVVDPISGRGEAVNGNVEDVDVHKENTGFLKSADHKEGHDVNESGNVPSENGRSHQMEAVNAANNEEDMEKSSYVQEKEIRDKGVASPKLANSPNGDADSFLTNASDSKNHVVNPANSDKETINEERLTIGDDSLHSKSGKSQKTASNDKKDAESLSENGLKSDKDIASPVNGQKQVAKSDTLNADEKDSSQAGSNNHNDGGVIPSKHENDAGKEGNIVAESGNDKEPAVVNAEHLNENDKNTKVGNESLHGPVSNDGKSIVPVNPAVDKESGKESPLISTDGAHETVVNSSNNNGKSLASGNHKNFHANENSKTVHESQDRIKEEKDTSSLNGMDSKGELHSKAGNESVDVHSEKILNNGGSVSSDNVKHEQENDINSRIPVKSSGDDDDKKAAELSLKKEGGGDQNARENSRIDGSATNGTNVNEVIKVEKTDNFANVVNEKEYVNGSSRAHPEKLAEEITSGGNEKEFSIDAAGTGGTVTMKASFVVVLISILINSKRN